jgi:Xaa-Pro dipeptidase
MSIASLLPGSMSSGEIQIIDPDRGAEILRRHDLLSQFMKEQSFDGLLLTRPSNFAWATVGGNSTRGSLSDTTAALFVSPDARVVLTRNTDSGRLFDREVNGLGFQLKERTWQEDLQLLMGDLCRGRNVACDFQFERCQDASPHLDGMRLPLSKTERKSLRVTGSQVAHAVEATARSFRKGDSEAEIAGQLAHRLYRHQIIPERIQILADGQGQRYRHWSFGDDKVEKFCTIAVIARREGLHVGAARTVSFGSPPKEVRKAHLNTLLVQATGMFFSQDQWEIYETWNRVERIYEKFGHSEEWHFSDQGCVMGYELCEAPIVPKSQLKLAAGMPIFWQSSIEQAMSADTILISEKGFDVLTPMENWPQIEVDVKGVPIQRPDVLVRSEKT